MAQQLVQAAHAAHESGILFGDPAHPISSIVLIGVSGESELLAEYARLLPQIPLVLFREPDLGDASTALATGPITGDDRRHFRRHKLWRS